MPSSDALRVVCFVLLVILGCFSRTYFRVKNRAEEEEEPVWLLEKPIQSSCYPETSHRLASIRNPLDTESESQFVGKLPPWPDDNHHIILPTDSSVSHNHLKKVAIHDFSNLESLTISGSSTPSSSGGWHRHFSAAQLRPY